MNNVLDNRLYRQSAPPPKVAPSTEEAKKKVGRPKKILQDSDEKEQSTETVKKEESGETPDDIFEWKPVCITFDEWEQFPKQFENSVHNN